MWCAPLNNSHHNTPGTHALPLLCTAAVRTRAQNNFSIQSGLGNLMRQHVQNEQPFWTQVTLLFLLQEQVILSGRYQAQRPHFGISKNHCCPGTESKTLPLFTNVGSSINGFNRTHFFLIHCRIDDATDLEATVPSLIFLTHDTQPRIWLWFLLQIQLAHLTVLLVLINLVLGL